MKRTLILLAAASSAIANAIPLIDGGFESYTTWGGNQWVMNPTSPAWTVTGCGLSRGPAYYPSAYQGTNFAFLSGNGTLSRTIEGLTPGVPYRLRFRMTKNGPTNGVDFANRVQVTIGGTNAFELYPLDNQWRLYEMPPITPTGTSQSLSILGLLSGTTMFDDFEVYTGPVTGTLAGGNFDAPGFLSNQFVYNPSYLADWRWLFAPSGLGGNGIGAGIASVGSTWGNSAHSGNSFAFIQMSGYAEQTLENLTVGSQYAVRFYQSSSGQVQFHQLRLKLDGSQFYGPVNNVSGWVARTSPIFTATAPRMTLRFEGINNGQNVASLIDSVELLPSSAGHDLRFNLLQLEVQPDSAVMAPIAVNVFQNGVSVFTTTVAAPPFGIFRPNIPLSVTGQVSITFDSPTHLKQRVNMNLPPANPNGGFVLLVNGDAAGSGEVDAADIDLVISKFGLNNTMPNFLQAADLDQSGEVDARDIDITISNFGALDE